MLTGGENYAATLNNQHQRRRFNPQTTIKALPRRTRRTRSFSALNCHEEHETTSLARSASSVSSVVKPLDTRPAGSCFATELRDQVGGNPATVLGCRTNVVDRRDLGEHRLLRVGD